MFKQGIGRNILRGDNNAVYFYIRVRTCVIRDSVLMFLHIHIMFSQSEKYGEFDKNGDLIIGRIPSFYQHCHPEDGLPGCLVKHDYAPYQCREGRTGKYSKK